MCAFASFLVIRGLIKCGGRCGRRDGRGLKERRGLDCCLSEFSRSRDRGGWGVGG